MIFFYDEANKDDESCAWKSEARAGKLIPAIRVLREAHGLGLKEAKDIVEKYVSHYRASQSKEASSHRIPLTDSKTLVITRYTDTSSYVSIETMESDFLGLYHNGTELLDIVAKMAVKYSD